MVQGTQFSVSVESTQRTPRNIISYIYPHDYFSMIKSHCHLLLLRVEPSAHCLGEMAFMGVDTKCLGLLLLCAIVGPSLEIKGK